MKEALKHLDDPGGLDRAADMGAAFHQDNAAARAMLSKDIGGAATQALAAAGSVGSAIESGARWALPDTAVDMAKAAGKWTIGGALGIADIPRAYLWKANAEAGKLAPDSDTEYGAWLGDKMGTFLSAAGKATDTVTDPTGLLRAAPAAVYKYAIGGPAPAGSSVFNQGIPGLLIDDPGDEDAYREAVSTAGRKLYNAFADGTLAQRAVTHVADVSYPAIGVGMEALGSDVPQDGWHPSQLTTEDLLDIAVPKEEAKKLALTATSTVDQVFWSMLSTNTGRAAVDLLLQMAVDPMWFLGTAGGSKLVAAGDTMARASLSTITDVAAVARRTGQDEIVLMTKVANDAVHGTKTAVTDAQNAVNIAKLALTSPAGKTAKELRLLEEDLRRASRLLDEVTTGDIAKRVVREGVGKYAVPWDETQRYAFKAGGTVDQLAKQVGKAAAYLASPLIQAELEATVDAIRAGRINDTLTQGQKMALYGARAVRGVWEVPAFAWETAARMFGSRSFHAAYLPRKSEVVKQAEMAGRPLGRQAAWGMARKVTAADPQNWATYVGAMEAAAAGLVQRKTQLMHSVMNITREARRVYDERKAAGTLPPGHTVANIMTEAADLVDRGAGLGPTFLEAHPDMRHVVQVTADLFQDVEAAAGVPAQQARQALAAMERTLYDSFVKYDELNRRVAALVPGADLWKDRAAAVAQLGKMRAATQQAATQAKTAAAAAVKAQQVATVARAYANQVAGNAAAATSAANLARAALKSANDAEAAAKAAVAARRAEAEAAKAAATAAEADAATAAVRARQVDLPEDGVPPLADRVEPPSTKRPEDPALAKAADEAEAAARAAPPPNSLYAAETGKPITIIGYRSQNYRHGGASIHGEGLYLSSTPQGARLYGTEVVPVEVTLRNPLVIKSDADWKRLHTGAGHQFLEAGVDEDKFKRAEAIKQWALRNGYDGIIVNAPRDESVAKYLNRHLPSDEVVAYNAPRKAAEASADGANAAAMAARAVADKLKVVATAADAKLQQAMAALSTAAARAAQARAHWQNAPGQTPSAQVAKALADADAAEKAARQALQAAATPGNAAAHKAALDALDALDRDIASTAIPQLPKFNGELRDLSEWEEDLYRRFREETDAAGFDANDRRKAALLMLRDEELLPGDFSGVSKPLPKGEAGPQGWNLEYQQMLGRRLGDVDPQMQPLVDMTRTLIERYEDAYKKVGLDIVKNPLEMFRVWGTVGYTPHVQDVTTALQRGQLMAATAGGDYRAVSSLDARFSTAMDAQRLRNLAGTISEINAADGAMTMSINPDVILARYGQANQAITSVEYILTLIQRGVAKVMTPDEARKLDYVPVLSRHERNRAWDTLLMGERGWHNAFTSNELAQMRTALSQDATKLTEGDSFAAWMSEIPEVRRANAIERMIVELNMGKYLNGDVSLQAGGTPLHQVLTAAAAGKARPADWDAAANWLNDAYHDTLRARNAGEPTVVAGRTTGEWLRDYYTSELRQLHVPADVVQNMNDAFAIVAEMPVPGSFPDKVKKFVDAANGWAKLRLTVIHTPFHAANLLGNTFMSIVDLGPFGALNPRTQQTAGRVAWAAYYHGKYGSLEEAWRILSEGRRIGENPVQFANRVRSRETFRQMALPAMQKGIDIGDGVTRPASQAIAELEKAGVLTGAYTDYNDINRYKEALEELYTMEAAGKAAQYGRTAAEYGEYALTAAAVATISGGIPFTVLPKSAGQQLANYVENVTRVANFVGNMKRSGSFAESAAHVEKYMHNWETLTAFQKVWLRSAFLFWAWPQKNFMLHAALLTEKPVYYSMLNTALVTEGPDLIDAYRHDTTERPDSEEFFHRARNTGYQESLMYPQEEGRFRVPTLRSDDIYATNLKTPVEAASDQARDFTSILSRDPRILGRSTYLIKLAIEGITDYSLYYGRPYSEVNSGQLVGQYMAGLTAQADYADEIGAPQAAAWLRAFREAVKVTTGWKQVNNSSTISTFAAKTLGNIPWRAALSNGAAMTMAYKTAMQDQTDPAGTAGLTPLSDWERAADAMLGMSFIQIDEQRRAAKSEREKKDAFLDIAVPQNIINEHEVYAPEK